MTAKPDAREPLAVMRIPDSSVKQISAEMNLPVNRIESVATLLSQGATIPFIARYRKELTGSLDEVAIAAIRDRMAQIRDLDERKKAILNSLAERDLLTQHLQEEILAAASMASLEDRYEKYRPKRRTKAMAAREKGLEPLALTLLDQDAVAPLAAAAPFLNADLGVDSIQDALMGARDIIAEMISDDPKARAEVRELFFKKAVLVSSKKKNSDDAAGKFKDYYDWSEPAASAPSHRLLALLRGERESILTLRALPPEESALAILENLFVKNRSLAGDQVRLAAGDAYRRLIMKSMETQLLGTLKQAADQEAIRIFSTNLKTLLLAPPLGQKRVLAIDPGFRTGCKVVCLDSQGSLIDHDVIYPHTGREETASATLLRLLKAHGVEAIAIGNGTAGRETETFVRQLPIPATITVVMVDESGASIYSASEIARREFPEHDITVRGAVSIGRRLMDPLAELVKIDPKSIGVGQYQHDVDQKDLLKALDDQVMFCVNTVGVEVNTASPELLARVAGLTPAIAASIVSHRESNGPFDSRTRLLDVPRLGPRTFEQAAGFLRIHQGKNPLDRSGIHPEAYGLVGRMAKDLGIPVSDLVGNAALVKRIDLKAYAGGTTGLPTLKDIADELLRPGRDPRHIFTPFSFSPDVHGIADLVPGMTLPGIVTNVTAFGAFVDIGVHQDGLVHISQLSDRFVKDPAIVVSVRQQVSVRVLEIDAVRKRIALSMKSQDPKNKGEKP
ncbi:MAG: Tex family protein [Pseudomonadota bacterium]